MKNKNKSNAQRDLDRNIIAAPFYLKIYQKTLAEYEAKQNPDQKDLDYIELMRKNIKDCGKFIKKHS